MAAHRRIKLGGCYGLALALSSSIAACRPSSDPDRYVHPDWQHQLAWGPESSGKVLWQAQAESLQAMSVDADLAERFKNNTVVMVTADRTSRLWRELRRDPAVLAAREPAGERFGFAAIALEHAAERDALAAAAHSANGHACGALTPIHLNGMIAAEPSTLFPPIFAGAMPLARVQTALATVQQSELVANIQAFEALGSRHHASARGRAAVSSIEERWRVALGDALGARASLERISHNATAQESLVVRFAGEEDADTTVIIGAHLDSINSQDRRGTSDRQAPGADDDASGVATLIEISRVLAQQGWRFARSVELHAYAAEEVGLIGSDELATSYAAAGRRVAGMMQFDMNSWSRQPTDQTIHLVSNETHLNQRRLLKDLLHTYLEGDFVEKSLSGGTSDHKSWHDAGYAAVFPFEDPDDFNDALHTDADTTTTANNFALSLRFAKLGLSYLAHHAGLVGEDESAARQSLRAQLGPDLKLAIREDTAAPGSYHINIATLPSSAQAALCRIDQAGSLGCVDKLNLPPLTSKSSGRAFFGTSVALPLKDGERLAIFAYDDTERLIAYRTVRLQKP